MRKIIIDWQWDFVDELEYIGLWDKALEFTFNKWKDNQYDLKILLRLAFLCWHLLVYWDPFKQNNFDKEKVQTILNEVTKFGFSYYNNYYEFLWIFGYMMRLFPYMFGDYFEMEHKGIEMLKQAHLLNKEDPITKMLYLHILLDKQKNDELEEEFKRACVFVNSILNERFKGNGVLAAYFKSALSNYFY